MIETFYEATPAAHYLATSSTIDRSLFARHTIETSLRIRLARIADSKVIQQFTRTNPFAAQKWCKYTEERMLHDRLFLKDLKHLGVNEETVYGTDPLLATKLLQGYLYYTIEHEGPRGLLSKAYFVEYILKKTQAAVDRQRQARARRASRQGRRGPPRLPPRGGPRHRGLERPHVGGEDARRRGARPATTSRCTTACSSPTSTSWRAPPTST